MADYHYRFAQIIKDRFDLDGKSVLEIGSQTNFIIAEQLVHHGAKEVVCVDKTPPRHEVKPPNSHIQFMIADAAEVPLPPGRFDLIVGVAVLEHMANIRAVTNELIRLLRPGGRAFLNGGGLWSSPLGHHLWVDHDGEQYRFNSENNPIPPWGHLLHSPTSLGEYLIRECGIVKEAARKIVDMVYYSTIINRAYPSQILRDLAHIDWHFETETYVASGDFKDHFEKEVVHRLPPHDDYLTTGINCFISRR